MIVPFTAADANLAAFLHQICFAHDPWPAHAFAALLESGAEGFIAGNEGEAIGLILCRAAGDEAEILTFAVIPSKRGNGIGTELLQRSIETLGQQRIEKLFLEVAKNNQSAISLYLKAGFVTVGERSGYYPGPEGLTDAYIMQKAISGKI